MAIPKKLQRIVAEDERAFQAMTSKQFGKGPIALRSVEQPKSNPPKKKKPRKVASRGESQFNVLSLGVLDALSNSIYSGTLQAPEMPVEMVAGEGDQQSPPTPPAEQEVPSKASREQKESAPEASDDQLPPDPRDTQPPEVDDDFSLEEQQPQDIGNLFNEIEVSRESPVPQEVKVPSATEVTSVGDESIFRTEAAHEVEDLVNEDLGIEDEDEPISLVQSRRDDARRESAAAARNFQRSQAPPILGIPDPAPMRRIELDEQTVAPNDDEKLMAQDNAMTRQMQFSQATVDIMEKMAIELQALSVRLRTVELWLDRQ